MPNWIEGTIKLRGKREDIARFIRDKVDNGCEYVHVDDYGAIEVNITRYYNYVEDTRRMFILEGCDSLDEEDGIICLPVKQAWSFKADAVDRERLEVLARKYDIDIKLYGIECGAQFEQEITVSHKGEVIYKFQEYEDWDWECKFPRMGG